jgi:LacI family transcriptional regulator
LVGTDHTPRLWKALAAWEKPTLLTWSCDARLPSIGFDNEAAARTATEHLLGLGHRRIGVISGLTTHNDRPLCLLGCTDLHLPRRRRPGNDQEKV